MGLRDRLRDTDTDIAIVLPGTDALIYEEAQSGRSWCSAGRAFGLVGGYAKVAARARIMAGSYARTYRQPWPLEDVDALDGSEAFEMAVQASQETPLNRKISGWEAASWDRIAADLGYESAADAEAAAQAFASRSGKDILHLRTMHFGRLLYEARRRNSDWSVIAKEVGYPFRRAMAAAEVYAKASGHPWPPPKRTAGCGEAAYNRRVETKESWEDIGKALGREWEFARRSAKEYAERTGKAWPIPIADYGPEAWKLRYKEHLSWDAVAERLNIPRSWAIRDATRHAALVRTPLPYTLPPDTDPQAQAYTYREQGLGWAEISDRMGCAQSVVFSRAYRYARANKKPWPVQHPPVREPSPRAKAAYERGYVAKEPWEEVAAALGYKSVASAKNSARCYADGHHIPLPVRRRRTVSRDADRPSRAYACKQADPAMTWERISEVLAYKSLQAAHTAARHHALKNGLPWPLPGDLK